jgi:4-amino-4-deoxychorismate lyase
VQSRGLSYGDGVFETCLYQPTLQELVLWEGHLARLKASLTRLGIALDVESLAADLTRVLAFCRSANQAQVVKLTVTRGVGGAGYASPIGEAERIWQVSLIQIAPLTEPVEMELAAMRLGLQPFLAGMKHLNRLEQVMAQQEAEVRGVQELLLLDLKGLAIESIRANVFWWSESAQTWVTPALVSSGVAGVARGHFLAKATDWGLKVEVRPVQDWAQMDECFLINSLRGISPVKSCGETAYQVCRSADLAELWRAEVMGL